MDKTTGTLVGNLTHERQKCLVRSLSEILERKFKERCVVWRMTSDRDGWTRDLYKERETVQIKWERLERVVENY